MTPATLSLADLAAAVVRLTPLHADSEDFIELVWVGRAYMQEPVPTAEDGSGTDILLAAANRLPAVVARVEALEELVAAWEEWSGAMGADAARARLNRAEASITALETP